MSKILKGIMLSEAPSEYGANLDWAAGKASQDTNEPQKYAIQVGPNKYVGDIYTDWNQADAKRKELAKKYFQVKVVPISKMNEEDDVKEGSVTSTFKIGPKSEYDKGKADSYYGRRDRSAESPNPKEYLRGYDENDDYKDWGGDDPVDEGLNEDVGGNYLYHATGGLKGILSSGSIRSAEGPQKATQAQTKLPTVSVTRDWNYASGGAGASNQMGSIGRDAIIILDRNAVESNFKTLGTSQSEWIRGQAFNPFIKRDGEASSQNTDPFARRGAKGKEKWANPKPKLGGEFEEAIVVPKGALPIKGTMVGFWINPKSELMNDPTVMNDPRRLELAPGGTGRFIKANQQKDVAEGTSNILKGISRMVKGKPTPSAEYQKYFDAYKKAMQTGDKAAIANATRDLHRIEKVAGPAFFEGLGLPFPGTYEQERGLESADEKLDEKWSDKYKRSIDCSHPKGFSQRAHCQGKKKK
jgi:hypothetical protein